MTRDIDDQTYCCRGYANAVRVERHRIESCAGRWTAAAEIDNARQVAEKRIAQARELSARLAANKVGLLPGSEAWLLTAEAEHAAVPGRDSVQVWAALVDTWQKAGQPYPQALARYQQADALLRHQDDRDQTRRVAVAALEIAERLGAAPLETEIRGLARRARIDLIPPTAPDTCDATRPAAPPNPRGLTDRKLAVLRLVADGKTNSEIGAALFISGKTASVHVTHILRKLDVATRVQAAAVAARTGLLHDPDAPEAGPMG